MEGLEAKSKLSYCGIDFLRVYLGFLLVKVTPNTNEFEIFLFQVKRMIP